MIADIAAVADLIRETAETCILPRFERLAADQIQRKTSGELVTIADIEAERALTPRLQALLPGSLVVGEEACAGDPGVLDRLAGETSVWLVDPVDGTANFAAGLPLFAVMIALVRSGQAVASWIYDPVKRIMASCEAGSGAWADGDRLQVAAETPTPSGLPVRYGNFPLHRRLAGQNPAVTAAFGYRCAGQEYIALAAGRTQAALYQRLMPWDHAPGVLLHREAGGVGRMIDLTPYSPRRHEGGLLLAANETQWQALRTSLVSS